MTCRAPSWCADYNLYVYIVYEFICVIIINIIINIISGAVLVRGL